MTTVTSADFQKNFGTYKKKALNSPVHITIHRKPTLVLISRERYDALVRRSQGKGADGSVEVAEDKELARPARAARTRMASAAPSPIVDEMASAEHLKRVAEGASRNGVFFKDDRKV